MNLIEHLPSMSYTVLDTIAASAFRVHQFLISPLQSDESIVPSLNMTLFAAASARTGLRAHTPPSALGTPSRELDGLADRCDYIMPEAHRSFSTILPSISIRHSRRCGGHEKGPILAAVCFARVQLPLRGIYGLGCREGKVYKAAPTSAHLL